MGVFPNIFHSEMKAHIKAHMNTTRAAVEGHSVGSGSWWAACSVSCAPSVVYFVLLQNKTAGGDTVVWVGFRLPRECQWFFCCVKEVAPTCDVCMLSSSQQFDHTSSFGCLSSVDVQASQEFTDVRGWLWDNAPNGDSDTWYSL